MALPLLKPWKLREALEKLTATKWWPKAATAVRIMSGIAAVAVFLAALTINIFTWFLPGVVQYEVWVVGTFAVFFVTGFLIMFLQQELGHQKSSGQDLPRWIKPILTALVIYTFAQIGSEFFRPTPGRNDKTNSESYETSYGQVRLEKTAEEIQGDLKSTRFFSTFMMIFSLTVAAQSLSSKEGKSPFGKYNDVVKRI
jgi:hypothetical protein